MFKAMSASVLSKKNDKNAVALDEAEQHACSLELNQRSVEYYVLPGPSLTLSPSPLLHIACRRVQTASLTQTVTPNEKSMLHLPMPQLLMVLLL